MNGGSRKTSYLNHFASADTIVPDPANPQGLNRYSYVYNNPIRYTDPSGHVCYDPSIDAATPGDCDGTSTPSLAPLPAGVENITVYASPLLQAFLAQMGIEQDSFQIKVHTNNQAHNSELFRYEIGAWILIQEHGSFHPINYPADSDNRAYFSTRGLYTAVVLLQVVSSREENYSSRRGIEDLYQWVQENPTSGQVAYPATNISANPDIYNDYLILANLQERGALPDFLSSYPDTPTSANPSGRPMFYGHYDLVEGVGEYAHGRESISVSSWAWAAADWVPTLDDFLSVTE